MRLLLGLVLPVLVLVSLQATTLPELSVLPLPVRVVSVLKTLTRWVRSTETFKAVKIVYSLTFSSSNLLLKNRHVYPLQPYLLRLVDGKENSSLILFRCISWFFRQNIFTL